MRPKISVIVPIYNAELYLEQCIESVLNQTLRDIELLLIDDGSTDNSFLICEKYKKRDNRIQLYTNKNVGQGLERNFGIKKSTGEYIAFLDSDDQYKENMLEKLYQRAIETNADMVSCRIVDMHDGKIIKEHPLNDKVLIGCKENTDTPPFIFNCKVKLINEDGSSPLQENKDKINQITVNLLSPINKDTQITDISYLTYYNCLNIQVREWEACIKNKGNYEQEYILEIQYPEEIRKEKDTIKIKYQFKNARPSIVEAHYNDIRATDTSVNDVTFEIEN